MFLLILKVHKMQEFRSGKHGRFAVKAILAPQGDYLTV